MIFKKRWFQILPVAAFLLLLGTTRFAFGQGPILTSLPTPTPVPATSAGAAASDPISAAGLPDLVVANIEVVPGTPKVNQPATLSVTIKNQGSVAVSSENNFLVDLYIDPPFEPIADYHQIENSELPWGAQWFWVPPGGSYIFQTTWVFTDVKTFEVWAQVDSGDDVVEANEDNNTKKLNVSVLTPNSLTHDTHQDFMTNMASTLDNSDPTGRLRLGRFEEPPFLTPPFANTCEISNVTASDYNMSSPDTRIHQTTTGKQVAPHLIDNGAGVLIAVWEDGRNGDTNRDIYLRYSIDFGVTWSTEQKVNDDSGGANQLNPVAALSDNGTLLVAWQDYRNGNYDIYAQRFELSGATLTPSGDNILVGGSTSMDGEQINPDIAVDESGGFHVAWQDKRFGHYDIFATSYIPINNVYTWTLVRRVHDDFGITQQVNPTIQVLDWLKVTGIDYSVAPTEPYTITVNRVISEPATILAVTWEDDRHGASDIAMVFSGDRGETFAEDQFLTNSPDDGDQRKPEVTLTKDKQPINFTVPLPDGSQRDIEVEVPVSDIHTVWEGYNTPDNVDRNIYYNQSQISVSQQGNENRFEFVLSIGSSEQINQNDTRGWQTAPVDQRDPALVAAPCGGSTGEDAWNIFIAWSDGRNYDNNNYDIYYDLRSSCGASFPGNQMLNDGVRLHNFDATNPSYSDYNLGHPPPGRQLNPSVAADIRLQGSTVNGGYLYLLWEDDRAGDPQKEKDIYFARSNLTYFNQKPYIFDHGAGSQISAVLDSGSTDTAWFTLSWSAITPASTYVTVQTRLGNTVAEVLASDWYPQRYPFQPQPWDCSASETGAPIAGYNSPGQHIEDASGNFWPKARYIQYRVNFFTRDETKTPDLDNLTLYYLADSTASGGSPGAHQIFLPLLIK